MPRRTLLSATRSPVWSKLGKAQLEEGFPADAIESYINAEDPSEYVMVCDAANEAEIWAELIPYLKMARKTLQENLLDTELIYAYAKTNNLTELEKFVNGPNVANIQNIGDKCFSEGLYQAAKILYININNNSKLALCHIHLEEYREAVAAAQKANNVSTWKAVCFACLRAEEFRLAATCGLEVIKYPDHVDEVVTFYSDLGYFEQLISLFEQGLGLGGCSHWYLYRVGYLVHEACAGEGHGALQGLLQQAQRVQDGPCLRTCTIVLACRIPVHARQAVR